MTLEELIRCANINLQQNGSVGLIVAKIQLQNAIDEIEKGTNLNDGIDNEGY